MDIIIKFNFVQQNGKVKIEKEFIRKRDFKQDKGKSHYRFMINNEPFKLNTNGELTLSYNFRFCNLKKPDSIEAPFLGEEITYDNFYNKLNQFLTKNLKSKNFIKENLSVEIIDFYPTHTDGSSYCFGDNCQCCDNYIEILTDKNFLSFEMLEKQSKNILDSLETNKFPYILTEPQREFILKYIYEKTEEEWNEYNKMYNKVKEYFI